MLSGPAFARGYIYMAVRYRTSGPDHDALLETGGVVLLQAEPQLCTLPGRS